ncbi:predicted protein [Chaetomium globosum CBS 148.51]|uniref:Uncharacterized protein n=1 Tax=Chaetomium globosum (strain ATCC 6205 / CBS 148.51 / DSM 1962 / NBRC 6347 / NRRL 1970) TaxID=306901 RepID=Q2H035_CHAGB|nr:uncharacterized protein CHGG_04861 [Chaetomium globosum CBS 148.51]EAQ88242.1 predicted protein [Chaetomium globosum CBS 148.51]
MVSLRSLFTGAVALMATAANAAVTPQQITNALGSLTQKAKDLNAPAQSITVLNLPLIIIGQGPFPQTLISGFSDIVSTANVLISQFDGTRPIQRRGRAAAGVTRRGPDADLLDRGYQGLLNILIEKAGLVKKIPVIGQPMAVMLRQVESVIDTITITLINLTESRADELTSEGNSLSGASMSASASTRLSAFNGERRDLQLSPVKRAVWDGTRRATVARIDRALSADDRLPREDSLLPWHSDVPR